jgi:pimeloyl-ACP methyl ester carboxylesterase
MATSPEIIMLPDRISTIRRIAAPQRYLSREYMAKNARAIYGGELRNPPHKAVENVRLIMPPTGMVCVQQLLTMWGFSSLPWLYCLRCPALIICGDDDPLIHIGNGYLLVKLIPGAKLYVMRGGGHLFMTMRSEETAGLLNTWIENASAID